MNLDNTLKNETLMFEFKQVCLLNMFICSRNSQCCLTLVVKEKWWVKYYTA